MPPGRPTPADPARPAPLVRRLPSQRRPSWVDPVGTDPLLRAIPGHVSWLDVPTLTFLVLRGRGSTRDSDTFARAVHTLLALDRACRMLLGHRAGGADDGPWTTPPEARWWVEGDDPHAFRTTPSGAWCWEVMVRQPDALTSADLRPAARLLRDVTPWRLHHVRVERHAEGECAQTLHVGPYGAAGPALRLLRTSLAEIGAARRGPLHEVYLDDPRHVPAGCVRTLLRQPLTTADDVRHRGAPPPGLSPRREG